MCNANDTLKETRKDSCTYAMELTKQFLTLSAAGIAFVVGLVYADKPGKLSATAVGWSLCLFGFSILCGWFFLMRMTGKINKKQSYDIYEPFAQLTSILQIVFFCLGVVALFCPTLKVAHLHTITA